MHVNCKLLKGNEQEFYINFDGVIEELLFFFFCVSIYMIPTHTYFLGSFKKYPYMFI
jgi:hypothetical protein